MPRHPRTAVGQLADGRLVLVVVDGRSRGYSVGMTNFELAQTLMRLGAVTAMALDGGGSTTIAFDGTLLNRPSTPASGRSRSRCPRLQRRLRAAAVEPVLSPNGDGVAETQTLAYKLVRPSTVTVTLVGAGRLGRLQQRPSASRARAPSALPA